MSTDIFAVFFFHLPLAVIASFLYVMYAGKALDKITKKYGLRKVTPYEDIILSVGAVVLVLIYLAIIR